MSRSGTIKSIAAPLCAAFALLTLPAQAEDGDTVLRAAEGAACDRGAFRIILDVGHTVDSPGAYSARGASEYGFNFFLTRQIERKLREAGFARTVVMITDGKARPSLAARIARANRMGGDLLLSVHHDSVPQKFKQDWTHDGKELEYSDRFKGHSIFVSYGNRDVRGSLLFGKLIGQELKQRGLAYTPHYKERFMGSRQRPLLDALTGVYSYDKLLVLKQTHMPAVLLEAGNIVNRDEELELLSEERQLLTSAAVTQAVDAYCRMRTGTQVAHTSPTSPRASNVAQRATKVRIRFGKKPAKARSANVELSAIKRR